MFKKKSGKIVNVLFFNCLFYILEHNIKYYVSRFFIINESLYAEPEYLKFLEVSYFIYTNSIVQNNNKFVFDTF